MKRLTECAWIDDNGALHISVPAMLKELGVPDTVENRERYIGLVADHLAALLKNHPAVIKITE